MNISCRNSSLSSWHNSLENYVPVLKEKNLSENRLKSFLNNDKKKKSKSVSLAIQTKVTVRYWPVTYSMVTFKSMLKDVKCHDKFRLKPLPPSICPLTRNDNKYIQVYPEQIFINKGL